MTPVTGHEDDTATPKVLTIGKVLAQLRAEFPEVTASKVRFLESEGLITPGRTRAGYRTYTPADLERLRYILAAQRDRYWPLKVIRDALDAIDRGLDDPGAAVSPDSAPRAPSPIADPEVPEGAALAVRVKLSLTGPELRQASGIDKATFAALETFGLLRPDHSGHFSAEALAVAAAAKTLGGHGLEPRHLRPFRAAADREIGLVEQVLATRRAGGTREERAAEIVSGCIALHVALVKAGLTR